MNDIFDLGPTIQEIIENSELQEDLEGDELTDDELAELQDWFMDLDEEEIC